MRRADARPLMRIVKMDDGELVASIRGDTLTLRPLRSRQGGPAEVSVKYGAVYYRAMLEKSAKPRKRRSR